MANNENNQNLIPVNGEQAVAVVPAKKDNDLAKKIAVGLVIATAVVGGIIAAIKLGGSGE